MTRLKAPVGDDDHVLGAEDAAATLVEYGDYQCPHCCRAQVVLKELMRLLRQRVRLVYRHFPLVTAHPVAQLAAEAAEQAAQADEFWGMHDLLFERQDFLDPQYLLTCAEELGLDVPAFAQSLESHVHLERVLRDYRSGARSGVNGTPTLFINGERYDGPIELGSLRAAIGLATHAVR